MLIDLHAHTTASDGSCAPAEVIARAVAADVRVLAITDHDTLDGIPDAIVAASTTSLTVIPGTELSVCAPQGQLHILAYLPEPRPAAFVVALEGLQKARQSRASQIVARLDELGYPIDIARVRALAGGSIGRPHIADVLVEAGFAADRNDAFTRLIGDDCPASVPHQLLNPRQALQLVAEAGGVACLAHPGTLRMNARQLESYIAHLKHLGLWGIEVYRAEHTVEQHLAYKKIARRLGLVMTGGSDFHGPDAGRHDLGDTGDPALPVEVADVLQARLTQGVASGV